MLVSTKEGITSKEREIIVPLCSVLARPHLEYSAQFWFSLYKKEVYGLERAHRSTTMTKQLEGCEESLKGQGLLSLQKG